MILPPPLHDWNLPIAEAIAVQKSLRDRLILEPPPNFRPKLVAGVDVTPLVNREDRFLAGIVVLRAPHWDVVEEVTAEHPAGMRYVTGLLSFREGPAILAAVERLACEPDVFVFDGAGTAHPRGIGIASHLGLWLDRPSVGCAKTHLVGEHREPGARRGCGSALRVNGQTVGRVVRTRDGVNPVFVSPGHRMNLAASVALVLRGATQARVPQFTRLAHLLVNRTVGRI